MISCSGIIRCDILLTALATIGILVNSKLDSLKAEGICLADIFTRNAVFKWINIRKNLSWCKGIFLQNDNLENWLKKPNSWPQKRKKQDWKFNCWFDKKRKTRFELNNPLLTGNPKILISHHCVHQHLSVSIAERTLKMTAKYHLSHSCSIIQSRQGCFCYSWTFKIAYLTIHSLGKRFHTTFSILWI